jgi:diguanylate cyclase (GGDEF)-like protein/PAS domain S-box-containing protein
MPEATARQFAGAIDALQAGGPAQNFDFNISGPQTTHCFVATLSLMIEDSGVFTVVRDVTARRAASREIERLGQRNALLLESVGEGIFDVDQQGNTTFANPAALAMLGLTQAQILGQSQHTLFHHHHADGSAYPADDCPIQLTLHDGQRRQLESEWFWRPDGKGFPVSMVVTPIEAEGKQAGVVVLFQDITERKRSEEEIHRLAFHDALTLLPNRRLLIDRLGQMLASSKRSGMCGAVLFLDLDNFKPLNDAQGHAVGDMLLVEVARRLNLAVREMDSVARFGGDEFVVMLGKLDTDPAAARTQAGAVAEKIRLALAQPYELTLQQDDGSAVHVRHHCTASMGLCLFPQGETSADEVLRAADAAMYRAKEAGRDTVRFHDFASPA